jgi:hypothetical protein
MIDANTPSVKVYLENEAECMLAQWALTLLGNYLENMTDDQNKCAVCGQDDYVHIRSLDRFDKDQITSNSLIVLDHEFVAMFEFLEKKLYDLEQDENGMYLELATEPPMVLDYMVNTILDPIGSDFHYMDQMEFWKDYGCAPSEAALRTIRVKLLNALYAKTEEFIEKLLKDAADKM